MTKDERNEARQKASDPGLKVWADMDEKEAPKPKDKPKKD